MRRAKRFLFSEQENRIICDLVKSVGENWDAIAQNLPGRTPKQIHDRYVNYLRQGLHNGPWTNEEDEILMRMYKVIGPKWSKMMQYLPGRSGNNIKNRWHKHIMKKYFEIEKRKSKSSSENSIADINDSQKSSNKLNSQEISFDIESGNLSTNDFSKKSFEKKIISCDNSIGKRLISNNKMQMPLENQVQHELQNFDFGKSSYNDFKQFDDNKNIKTLDNHHKSEYNDKNPISMIKKVDINDQSNENFCESKKLQSQNSFLFTASIEIQEFIEELCMEKFDFL